MNTRKPTGKLGRNPFQHKAPQARDAVSAASLESEMESEASKTLESLITTVCAEGVVLALRTYLFAKEVFYKGDA